MIRCKIKKLFCSQIDYSFYSKPLYEAALSSYIEGNYDKTNYFMNELKSSLKSEGKYNTKEYIELLRKDIKLNKSSNNITFNIQNINEIHKISNELSKGNFFNMQEDVISNITYMINYHPKESIDYINKAADYFPEFFDPIFKFYLGTAYLLEGSNVQLGIDTMNNNDIIGKIEDKELKTYYFNNISVGMFWKATEKFKETKKETISYEIIEQISKDIYNLIQRFKEGISLMEEITNDNFKEGVKFDSVGLRDKFNLSKNSTEEEIEEIIKNTETLNEIKQAFLSYFLSSQPEKENYNQDFSLLINKFSKVSLFKSNLSAFILFNLAETYFNIHEYKKSLLCVNFSNHLLNINENRRLFLRNLSLIAYIDFKLHGSKTESDKRFTRIISEIKDLDPSPEISYIYDKYANYLTESNESNPIIQTYFDNIKKLDKILDKNATPGFSYRKSCLIVPKDE